jgi:hypothetical protein
MDNRLYDADVLAWSEQQAALLRRLGRGETVPNVDWTNVAEEIEGVGLSILHDTEIFLVRAIVHLLQLQAWPDNAASNDWYSDIIGFQHEAQRRITPSMRLRIDVAVLYASALRRMRKADRRKSAPRNNEPRPWPEANPFALDDLLNADPDDLLRQLSAANRPDSAV